MDINRSLKSRWLPDHEITHCMKCKQSFTFFIRKHHCRSCGGIFCYSCCSRKILLPQNRVLLYPSYDPRSIGSMDDPHEPLKCCDHCIELYTEFQNDLRQILAKSNKETMIDYTSLERILPSPISFSLHSQIQKATYCLLNMSKDKLFDGDEDNLPRQLLMKAKGIAFLTTLKLGMMFTGTIGTGLVIKRLHDGWSAPSAIMWTSLGYGMQVGGSITEIMILLTSSEAVDAFTSDQISIGTELNVSMGPVGRLAGSDLLTNGSNVSTAYSYAHSKGLFVGVSLEAGIIMTRHSVNQAFYGYDVKPSELFQTQFPRPTGANILYKHLNELLYPKISHDLAGEMVLPALTHDSKLEIDTQVDVQSHGHHGQHGFDDEDVLNYGLQHLGYGHEDVNDTSTEECLKILCYNYNEDDDFMHYQYQNEVQPYQPKPAGNETIEFTPPNTSFLNAMQHEFNHGEEKQFKLNEDNEDENFLYNYASMLHGTTSTSHQGQQRKVNVDELFGGSNDYDHHEESVEQQSLQPSSTKSSTASASSNMNMNNMKQNLSQSSYSEYETIRF